MGRHCWEINPDYVRCVKCGDVPIPDGVSSTGRMPLDGCVGYPPYSVMGHECSKKTLKILMGLYPIPKGGE